MIRLLPVLSLLLIAACMKNVDPGTASSAPAPAALECRLESEPPLVAGGPVRVRLTLTSSSPTHVLIWNTPFEPRWKGTIFSVTRDGQEIAYSGPMTKRGDPTRDEYRKIEPGQPAVATADLAQVYDLSQPGNYEVKVVQGLVDVTTDAASVPRPRDQHDGAALNCASLNLTIATR